MSNTASNTTYFFDSWGALYVQCAPSHPDAVAFGPRGVSRAATLQEACDLLDLAEWPADNPSQFSVFSRTGRVWREEDSDWIFVKAVSA